MAAMKSSNTGAADSGETSTGDLEEEHLENVVAMFQVSLWLGSNLARDQIINRNTRARLSFTYIGYPSIGRKEVRRVLGSPSSS